jgi:hypothetical protein
MKPTCPQLVGAPPQLHTLICGGALPGCRLVHNVLQQLEDAHRHAPALQRHALAFPPVLLGLVSARARRWQADRRGATGRERALKVREVRVVVGGLREGEAAEGELDEGYAEGPDVGLDGVLRALYALGLRTGQRSADGELRTYAHVCRGADEGVGDGCPVY